MDYPHHAEDIEGKLTHHYLMTNTSHLGCCGSPFGHLVWGPTTCAYLTCTAKNNNPLQAKCYLNYHGYVCSCREHKWHENTVDNLSSGRTTGVETNSPGDAGILSWPHRLTGLSRGMGSAYKSTSAWSRTSCATCKSTFRGSMCTSEALWRAIPTASLQRCSPVQHCAHAEGHCLATRRSVAAALGSGGGAILDIKD